MARQTEIRTGELLIEEEEPCLKRDSDCLTPEKLDFVGK